MTKLEFYDQFKRFISVFGPHPGFIKHCNESHDLALDEYFNVVKDIPLEEFKTRCDKLIRTLRSFPLPVDFLATT